MTGNELANKLLSAQTGMQCADMLIDNLDQIIAALRSSDRTEERRGVFVPEEVWDWLMGEGPDFVPTAKQLEGSVFAPGRYWWRSELRRRIDAAGGEPQRGQE